MARRAISISPCLPAARELEPTEAAHRLLLQVLDALRLLALDARRHLRRELDVQGLLLSQRGAPHLLALALEPLLHVLLVGRGRGARPSA